MEETAMNKNFTFGTKAETLAKLQPQLKLSSIPALFFFSVSAWKKNPEEWIAKAKKEFGAKKIIVRSSASSEDSSTAALAGVHDSIANISASNAAELKNAVEQVIHSYEKKGQADLNRDQVLLQEMISDVSMSGVVFTQEMNTGAPYFVINYDDQTGKTDTVTAGGQYSNRTLYVQRNAVPVLRSERFKKLLEAVKEIETITNLSSLDIEFAVTQDNRVHLFQARQITTHPNWNRAITLKVNDSVERIKEFLQRKLGPSAGIHGEKALFGQMPDWNPAEMIGSSPRPLALSLYRKLITDATWRQARRNMGYQEPRGAPLLYSIAGKPYIDVRMSFNSFLPEGLSKSVSEKLVNAWTAKLAVQKELHDKVEFEVAVTSYAFDFETVFSKRYPGLLSPNELEEFRNATKALTENLVTGKVSSIESDLAKVEELKKRQSHLAKEYAPNSLLKVKALLEDCVELGTRPFSALARHAFIAKSFLRSMVLMEIATESEVALLQTSVETVTAHFIAHIKETLEGKMTKAEFMERYGHLRPGTYDILSLRYDQKGDFFNTLRADKVPPLHPGPSSLSKESLGKLERALKESGFSFSAETLLKYSTQAIAAREYSKFVFTKNISDALESIAQWGEGIGLSREELSYLQIQDLIDGEITSSGRTLEHHLRSKANEGREEHELTCALHLPQVIESVEDACIVPLLLSRPNFITRQSITADFLFLDGHESPADPLTGKIILIESADPGFDWIFSHKIAGLVTKYGGVNSHMAVRCAEFGIPAAIGCGEQIFDRLLRGRQIEIDCASSRVVPTEEE